MAIVTFETLREVQRKEKKTEKLAELSDEFYAEAMQYFERSAKNDLNEARNGRSIFDDIVDKREKKILNHALQSVRLRERADLRGMTTNEREFFSKLVDSIKEFRESVDANSGKIEMKEIGKTKEEVPIERENPLENPDFIKIKVLEDVPEIVGIDMNDYGPFKKGEIARLPRENAELFVNKGKAERV